MLLQFSVENFRSFRDLTTLSMVAADIASLPKSLDATNVFSVGSDLKLLTSAAMYGANASGKSNLILALRFMRNFVLSSARETQIGDAIEIEPFLLNPQTANAPSRFEIVFCAEGQQFRYGFRLTSERIIEEWLYRNGKQRETNIFTREGQSIKSNPRAFREGRNVAIFTRENALFLSVAAQFNSTVAAAIVTWFRQLRVNAGVNDMHDMSEALIQFEQSPYRATIEQLVRRFDVGIDALAFERGQDIPSTALLPEFIQHFLPTLAALTGQENAFERVGVKTSHRQFDTEGQPTGEIAFDLEHHESAGTRRLFTLAFPIVRALAEGLVLVIDEIDARVHPNLIIELVRLFNSPETNPRHGQLVFTTHNTNLLNAGLFRRDQIWFVEKSRQGASDLYSLVEYREAGKVIRNDASFEKDYVMGRYGAVPFLGDLAATLGSGHATPAAE